MFREKSLSEEARHAIQRDEEITQRLNEDKKNMRNTVKVLLLGKLQESLHI